MKKIIWLISLSLILVGCSPNNDTYLKAVRAYNETKIIALVRPQPELMARVSTEKEQARVLAYIFYWEQKKKVIECKINEIKLEKVVQNKGEKVEVITNEGWQYRHLDAKNKKPVDKWKTEKDRVRYELTKAKGEQGWLIDKVEVLNTR